MEWQVVFAFGILTGWILRGIAQLIEKKVGKNREDKK